MSKGAIAFGTSAKLFLFIKIQEFDCLSAGPNSAQMKKCGSTAAK